MQLKQAEIIQVLRRRAGMNQGDFGAKAFSTSYESGRTKVKNLELGKQKPTEDDLVNMARVLGLAVDQLRPTHNAMAAANPAIQPGVVIKPETLAAFPGLEAYLEMLDKAVRIGDSELIGHIAQKIAAIFSDQSEAPGEMPQSRARG